MITLKSLCPVILHRDESGTNFVMRYANVEITSHFYFQIRQIRDAIRECGIHFTFFREVFPDSDLGASIDVY